MNNWFMNGIKACFLMMALIMIFAMGIAVFKEARISRPIIVAMDPNLLRIEVDIDIWMVDPCLGVE